MRKFILIISFLAFNYTFSQIDDFKHIDFTVADNIAKLHDGENLNNLSLLSYNLTHKLTTDVEKFRAIYSWVCNNIKGDYYQHNKVDKKQNKYINDSLEYIKWNNEYKKIAFKKLLKYKKTMCTGYAYLIKELAYLSNIECEIIDGYSRTVESNVDELYYPNHSWNAVKLNNKWYLCDATWSSGYMEYDNTFIKDYNLGYFLTDPVLFAKNHLPLDSKWLLTSKETVDSFLTYPILYNASFRHKILPVSPSLMQIDIKKNEDILFELKTFKKLHFKKITLVHYYRNREKYFPVHSIEYNNETLKFKGAFKSLGHFDVHLMIDNDIIATYTISVTK